jgi:hypothetical protein
MQHADMLGRFAPCLVFATFCARRMAPPRALVIAGNIAVIGYGCLGHLWPIIVLHAAMLPFTAVSYAPLAA